jgi:hypothetical protein
MKTKQPAGAKKQTIVVKDLKTKKNPKGGACGTDYFLKRSEVVLQDFHFKGSRDTKHK